MADRCGGQWIAAIRASGGWDDGGPGGNHQRLSLSVEHRARRGAYQQSQTDQKSRIRAGKAAPSPRSHTRSELSSRRRTRAARAHSAFTGYAGEPASLKGGLALQNAPKIIGVGWFLGEVGLLIDKVDQLQRDLDWCRARLLGGSEEAELLSVLTLVVGRHGFQHAVEHDGELPGYVSERGSRSHASSSEALVHVAKRVGPDRRGKHDHGHLAKDVTRRTDAAFGQFTTVSR